jgi:hypothetical protein
MAREAISSWLLSRKRAARREAVMEYAAKMAGTQFDLDVDLESGAVEELMKMDRQAK